MGINSIFFEDLSVGQVEELSRTVTEGMIQAFAEVSGDENPLHLDEEYALSTRFGGRIAHGMLSAAFISAVIGTKLPGRGCIYLSQTLRFRRPVRIGDVVVTKVTVRSLDPQRAQAVFETVCRVADKIVVEGEAVVLVARKGS